MTQLTKHRLIDRMIDATDRMIDVTGGQRFHNRLSSDAFRCGVQNAADGTIEILVYGYVGDEYTGLTARGVAELLASNPTAPVLVRVNSPGGLAFDGITIHNALVMHAGPVTVVIEGIAASAASIIAAAGDPVKITGNASIFIHRAMSCACGDEGDLQDLAEFLRGLDRQIARTLAAKSGESPERMLELMRGTVDGTSFDAEAAVAIGLADEILPIRPAKNQAGNALGPLGGVVSSDKPLSPEQIAKFKADWDAMAKFKADWDAMHAGPPPVELEPADPPAGEEGEEVTVNLEVSIKVVQDALEPEAAERLVQQQRLWEAELLGVDP